MKQIYVIFISFLGLLAGSDLSFSANLRNGADRMEDLLPLLAGKRVGLVINQTSVVGGNLTSLPDTLLKRGIEVAKIFAPEHGFRGTADAGEVINNCVDKQTGLRVISLYGKNKKPQKEQLEDVDVMVFDMQDVGARFYTYISTLYYVMEACAMYQKDLVVLDRPNPCDYIDGPVLKAAYKSFVGMLPIPILHGCTLGEMALMIKGEKWIDANNRPCKLTIIPVENWKHGESYKLPIKPSPNLPNDQAIALYTSLCFFEATQISVGRGTYFPFQVIGAPDKKYGDFCFTPKSLPGFDKSPLHKNRCCYGIDLRNIMPAKGLTLSYFLSFYAKSGLKDKFFTRPHWFDLLAGTDKLRKQIINGLTEEEIRQTWQHELSKYKAIRKKYLLYTNK